MSECGIVTAVERGVATIALEKNSACSACRLCLYSEEARAMLLKASAPPATKVGDHVQVHVDRSLRARAQLWLLAVPLAIFLGSALLSRLVAGLGDGLSLAVSLACMAAAFGVVAVLDRRHGWSSRPVARIVLEAENV